MPIEIGILSTFPPTQCGLATFSKSLRSALSARGCDVGVVSVVDVVEPSPPAAVQHQWVRNDPSGARSATAALNRYDVVIVQHEYGIFPGRDGVDVLDVVRDVQAPVITVLHTVLTEPSRRQRLILQQLARQSFALVVMTETGRDRLTAHYDVDPGKIFVIPHGSADILSVAPSAVGPGHRPTILTWGLLGDGKGIEWAIEALPALAGLDPRPRYHVLGETHPRVLEQRGEQYRVGLVSRAAELGVSDMVRFDARYLGNRDLHPIVRRADVILLPYDSRDQVTSGVLIEAVAAGKPVVSTGFPHACELLTGGAGLIVERQNPGDIAAALRRVLTEPGLAESMAAEASRIAPSLLWSSVADRYAGIAVRALRRPPALAEPA